MSAPGRSAQPFWRRRLLLPALALAALNGSVFLAYTLPRILREKGIVAGLESRRERVERARRLVATLERRAETQRKNAEDGQRFYGEMIGPRGARLVPLLREIEGMAREVGVAGGRASYNPGEVKGAPLERFEITMPLSGSYDQVVAFLDRIERSPQFLIVDRMLLRESQDRGGTDLNVVISAYFRLEKGGGRGR